MKAIITLTIVLLFGVIAQAHSNDLSRPVLKKATNLKAIAMTKASSISIEPKSVDCAYLSKFKNTRVKKALRFSPQNKKTKIA